MKSMEGALNWFEIPVHNLARAKEFYEMIFEIRMQQVTLGTGLKMAIFPVRVGTVGGALCEYDRFYKPSHDGVLVYLNANPELQNVIDRVEDGGGRVVIARTQISPEMGYMSVFEDTEGNRIALRAIK
jgi:predicted enzyme related to lactoylglutathione lyase